MFIVTGANSGIGREIAHQVKSKVVVFKRFHICSVSHLNVLVGTRERESDYGLQVYPKDLMLEDFTLL